MMLHEFVTEHRDAIIERARVRVASRRVPMASETELASGVPLFLSQLVAILREQQRDRADTLVPTTDARVTEIFGEAADQVGDDVLRAGLTVAQVVEGYGDVCQAITEEAIEHDAEIAADEYRTLNLSVDVATARAVTAFSRGRDRSNDQKGAERLGMLAHELRNRLSTAVLSFEALRRQLLTSAVANLIQNAMKFTRAGGRVTVTATRSDTHALIAVEDECGGLPDAHAAEASPAFEKRGADRSGPERPRARAQDQPRGREARWWGDPRPEPAGQGMRVHDRAPGRAGHLGAQPHPLRRRACPRVR